jgi:hypothetical protein
MIQRYTIETLESGQPRPYADHVTRKRVTFERDAPSSVTVIVPQRMDEQSARLNLLRLQCGFTLYTRTDRGPSMDDHFKPVLDWLKPIDGIPASEAIEFGDPSQIVASVWEFQVTTPFTD